jgi:glycosyltransferase involved in cell wall biosynthesis
MENAKISTIHFSVAICTRNRAWSLRRTLQSLVQCKKPEPPITWEVLVIDNGSTDETKSVIRKFEELLPLRNVEEASTGLANARNRAVRESRGDWLLWIDDDVTVHPGWLFAYQLAAVKHPNASVFGGPIEICFEGIPPHWILAGQKWLGGAYAGRTPDQFSEKLDAKGAVPYGANFVLRQPVAQSFPFDASLGRHPMKPYRGGEEIRVIRKVLKCGKTGFWVLDALVYHHIDKSRQTSGYLRSYYFDVGLVTTLKNEQASMPRACRKLIHSLGGALYYEIRYLVACLMSLDNKKGILLKRGSKFWGKAYGNLQQIIVVVKKQLIRGER